MTIKKMFFQIGNDMCKLLDKAFVYLPTKDELERAEDYDCTSIEPNKIPLLEPSEPLIEKAGSICIDKSGNFSFISKCLKEEELECDINYDKCKDKGLKHFGSMHTHPIPCILPSVPDLKESYKNNERVICIGTKPEGRNEISCYELRGGKKITEEDFEHLSDSWWDITPEKILARIWYGYYDLVSYYSSEDEKERERKGKDILNEAYNIHEFKCD
jgi:proteasome lid subunit RPN8/RPN11